MADVRNGLRTMVQFGDEWPRPCVVQQLAAPVAGAGWEIAWRASGLGMAAEAGFPDVHCENGMRFEIVQARMSENIAGVCLALCHRLDDQPAGAVPA